MTTSRYIPTGFRLAARLGRKAKIWSFVDTVGFVIGFCWQVVSSIPFTLKQYRSQTMRMVGDLTWGRGTIIVGGGTAAVMVVMGAAVGASIGIEAYSALNLMALGQLSGLVSAFGNTRELAPIVAGIGFAAQAGCRMTAEIGSMRISEEIDAIEALGVRSVPFVVTTRTIAGLVVIVPTFLIALILSYISCTIVITSIHGEPSGVYNHYFDQFVVAWDIVAAVIKVTVFAVAVTVIHCYQGFYATGGPEGVGIASGRAIRASLVAIIALDMLLTILLWGFTAPLSFTG